MKYLLILAGALVLGVAAYSGGSCVVPPARHDNSKAPKQGDPIIAVSLPDTLSAGAQIGKRGFDSICAACHGENASGREGMGPPLVHDDYRPGHRADMAFRLAVQNGVPAHHWSFGNMPPQDGLTRADVAAITTYVRELQRANGIN